MVEKHRGAHLAELFDSPLSRDWIAWMAALWMALGVFRTYKLSYTQATYSQVGSLRFETGEKFTGEWAAFVIDSGIAIAISFAIFGLLPAAIRKSLRMRRGVTLGRTDVSIELVVESSEQAPTRMPLVEGPDPAFRYCRSCGGEFVRTMTKCPDCQPGPPIPPQRAELATTDVEPQNDEP